MKKCKKVVHQTLLKYYKQLCICKKIYKVVYTEFEAYEKNNNDPRNLGCHSVGILFIQNPCQALTPDLRDVLVHMLC